MEYLGSGSYGDVLKCRHKLDKQFYAVKRIKLPRNKKDRNEKAHDTFQTFCEGIQIKKKQIVFICVFTFVPCSNIYMPQITIDKEKIMSKKVCGSILELFKSKLIVHQSKSGVLTNLLPWSRKISDLEQTQPLGFCYDLITSYKLISYQLRSE